MHTPSATQSLLALSCLFCTTLAMAEEKPALEEVVVTATRFPEKRAAIPAHVSVITAEQIRNSNAANVPDLLRGQAGVTVTDITGTGRSYTVDLRGSGETAASNTLVLVDGRRINQADLSGSDWLQIPLERVEKIEIIRGSGAGVLYGDNASAGVVNILTKEGGMEPLQVDANAEVGSYGIRKIHMGMNGYHNKLFYALDTGSRAADGYRDNSNAEAHTIGLNLRYDWNDHAALTFSSGYQKDEVGLPGALKESDFNQGRSRRDTLNPKDYAKTEDYFFHAGPELRFGEGHLFKTELSFRRRTFESYSNFSGGEFTGQSSIDTWSANPRIQLSHTIGSMPDKLTVGFDVQTDKESIHNNALFFGARTVGDFSLEKRDIGYYLHNELRLDPRLALMTGYRTDSARFEFQPSTPESITMDEEAFSASLVHDVRSDTQLYADYSKSFRYPLLDEQYSFFTNTVTTNLLPQRTETFQIGSRYQPVPGFHGDVHLFLSNTEREIYYDTLQFNNLNMDGKVRRYGLELRLEKQFEQWFWRGDYTWTEAKIQDGTYAGKQVPGVAKHAAGMTLRYAATENMTVSLDGHYVGSKPFISDFSNSFDQQSSYIVADSSVRYRWPRLTGFVTIYNLTDKEYAEYGVIGSNSTTFAPERAYFPSPERHFLVGVSANF